MTRSLLTAKNLSGLPKLRHGFFTRCGGVSQGVYQNLNCGLGSNDERARVLQNRAYVAGTMNVAANRLVTPYQAHTVDVVVVDKPFDGEPPKADALITRTPDIAIAISTADCTPILLCDPDARIIAAVHAGWRGAVGGILVATIEKMVSLDARVDRIMAAIGPAIQQQSYEVGEDVISAAQARDSSYERFFRPAKAGHAMFDVPGLVMAELAKAGVTNIENLGRDTYAEEELFFSYRRMTHRKEADYGRHLHAIVLEQ
ncbi:MAG: peptidoglycan editing factor PgeF [Pseudomonadota bacterium]